MNFKAVVKVEDNPDLLYKSILPEVKGRDRSSFKVKKNKDSLEFDIGAKDMAAFRATMNSLLQSLAVYYKIKEVKNG